MKFIRSPVDRIFFRRSFFLLIYFFLMFHSKLFCDEKKKNIMIFAPASLRDSLIEVLNEYKTKNQIDIKDVYLGTANLAQQIKNGAKPDIFISANLEWIEYLEERDLVIKKYRHVLLSNSLVAITSKNNYKKKKKSFTSLKDVFLNTKTRISLALVDAVPAGIYAKEYFKNIGIWQSIESNIATSPNVRAALSFVSRGDLEYGVVYKSDALADKKVKIIFELDQSLHTKIQYPMTILNENQNTINLYMFLISSEASRIFKKWGFLDNND